MLERLVAWVLNSYIGDYFGNVNTDQLSVALHQGEVELEGLPLKVEAFRHWDLPIEIKAGFVGKIRLKINNVHIRYEDSWSIPKTPFACGLVISCINVQTTDENDSSDGSPKKSGIARKAVLLDGFNIYWDNNVTLIDNLSLESLIDQMRLLSEKQVEPDGTTKDHDYLVCSVNGKAQIKQNAFDDLFKTADNFMLDFQLEKFPLRLTLVQYRLMLEWSSFLNRTKKLWKYRRWRPVGLIKDNPKAWWKYAINANMDVYRKRKQACTWKFLIQRVKDILDYTDIYYSYLTEIDSLTKEMEEIKERIETNLTYEELACLRELVFHNIKKNQENLSVKRGGDENNGFFQNWLNWWYSETATSDDLGSDPAAMLVGETSRLSISYSEEPEAGNIAVNFQVPQLACELVTLGENGCDQSLVKIVMQDFALYFSKYHSYESKIKITLKSLIMEDLLVPDYSTHRFIMSSEVYKGPRRKSKGSPERKFDFLSTSCPTSPQEMSFSCLSSHFSLPTKLQKSNIYHLMPYSVPRRYRHKIPLSKKRKVSSEDNIVPSCPSTPPCSPTSDDYSTKKISQVHHDIDNDDEDDDGDYDNEEPDNTLVKISFLFVDENSPLFETKYNRNHRFVNIQFNSLETIINPETWAKILNFFEPLPEKRSRYESELDHVGLKAFFLSSNSPSQDQSSSESGSKLEIDSKIDLTIRRLSIILNKPEDQPLAKANIHGFSCFYSKYNGNVLMEGKLKKLSILDLTQFNEIYRERFITSGKEALNFTFFKYGQEDETMKREYDMNLRIQMASVQYVHTQRFYTETMHFLKQFNILQLKIKALSAPEVLMNLHRSTRISLDIKAAAPVIIIPVHHLCESVLVADFGQLTVTNKFLYAGSPGTIGTVCKKSGLTQSDLVAASVREKYGVITRVSSQSLVSGYVRLLEPKPCLLDVIDVQLPEMDLYSGFVVRKKYNPKTNKYTDVNYDENYEEGVLDFPSFRVKRLPGRILKERFIFSLQIERNLEAEFNHSLPDISMLGKVSAVRCTIDSPRYQLIRGVLDNNLGEPMDHIAPHQPIIEGEGLNILLPNRIWTSMAIHLDLKNVSLEIVDGSMDYSSNQNSIARIDFLSSRLSIESFTDSSKDIDLVSQEIKIIDARYLNRCKEESPNVFPGILQPAKKGLSATPLQVEIHYRSKRNHVCLTILLNNMRVMAIFDWFKEMSDFLSQPINFQKTPTAYFQQTANSSYANQLLNVDEDRLPDFELKFNITDTELVVVENCSIEDTNAVILKGTAILNLATDLTHPEPFNCTLEGVEVFSCVLGVEEETALSIVDPLNVTIDMAPKVIHHPFTKKETGHREEVVLVFDVSEISLRLSYKDIFLFTKILNSLPTQTKVLSKSSSSPKHNVSNDPLNNLNDSVYALPPHISQLQSMGFKESECIQALENCKGNINEAAIWLTHSVRSPSSLSPTDEALSIIRPAKRVSRFSKFNFETISLQIGSCIFCLIDDCKDTDVPLFEEITLIELYQDGNRFWKNDCLKKLSVEINSSDSLNLVITNTCLELYKSVFTSWIDEYNLLSQQKQQPVRRRSPFIPFAIKNESGCDMRFTLVTSNVGEHLSSTMDNNATFSFGPINRKGFNISSSKIKSNKGWVVVKANAIVPFTFDGPAKARHQDSHLLKSHKIVVQIDGWQPIFPVSVDKVGKYFREAKPENVRYETARIVFDITLESNARKLITVRSALMLYNGTNNSMEVKFGTFSDSSMYVMPQTVVPVPLHLIRSKIFARPCDIGVNMCETPIIWEHVRRMSDASSELLICTPITITKEQHSSYTGSPIYKFVSSVSRENFPTEERSKGTGFRSSRVLPAHQISLLPPLQLCNLLPFELRYRAKNYPEEGSIKPGGTTSLQYIDTSKEFSLSFNLDNYPKCSPLVIGPNFINDFLARIELFDKKDRPLNLLAQISLNNNSPYAISINILSPFWFVNRTGLPLILKQESADKEASGQFEEHEIARSISPLLFSFYEPESSFACVMRLGKSFGRTRWCNPFYLQKGTTVRKLRIASSDPRRPDKVYEIGIEVRPGKGRYRDTYVVTLSPRYQIENSSSFSLEITQKYATLSESDSKENLISVLPNSNVAFHWPRSDQDRLVCVRLASLSNGCHWSGGFAVSNNSSFYLNVRDSQGKSHFIRLEILAQGATSFIIFSDPGNLPPPIRVDNFSEVPIEFYQTNTSQAWMKTTVKPKSSVPYAWDESTLKPHLTVSAPGGCSATYDLNSLRPGDNLSYENFFYIAFSGTFLSVQESENDVSVQQFDDQDIKSMQLVLDVPEGSRKVIINRKEPGRRSQLWRMDQYRRLLHEGSSPPKDPRKSGSKNEGVSFVLDIEAHCAYPGQYSSLVLRSIDNKRSLTQYWNFTQDGRLSCEHPGLYVQPKDGFLGLFIGNDVVLGPPQPITYAKFSNGIPFEQALSTQKMRKGSGLLSVQVCTDGPSRVLQVMDVRNIPPSSSRSTLRSSNIPSIAASKSRASSERTKIEFNIVVKPSNVGFSLVNQYNEEIVYLFFNEVVLEYQYKVFEHRINCSVRYFQADNQIIEAEKPVIFHTMELEENNPLSGLPALHIFIHKLILPKVEAQFFEDVQITIKDIGLNLEELLMLKFYEFLGYPKLESESELVDDEKEDQNVHKAITSAIAKSPRLYFSNLQIKLDNVKLSVLTSSHLPPKLSLIKKKLRLRLIRFEDAKIGLLPFRKNYSLETFRFLIEGIVSHYHRQLRGQAAKILGSFDFLGNPLGFVNDVTDGLSELINEGNVGGLILNLAHGISDSTAKFTSVLSDGLGVVTMDDRHQEIRKRIKHESNDHLKAGIKGLGVGILGGFTSIITQTYEGAVNEGGVGGFFSGFGKGLLGTITKPAVGMLDFATSAAIAVRDTSRKISNTSWSQVRRIRPPRQRFSVHGPGSLLPHYSLEQSRGQEFFYKSTMLNDKDDDELFISFKMLRADAALFISSHKIHLITWTENPDDRGKGQISVSFEFLQRCETATQFGSPTGTSSRSYLVLVVTDESCPQCYGSYHQLAELGSTKPKIRCQSEQLATEATQLINFAKASYQENHYIILS
uniref:UBA domain-containing protein n=1 Tax=Tetranychus urticae TaxID=32264 RepID=T1KHU8_TETUR